MNIEMYDPSALDRRAVPKAFRLWLILGLIALQLVTAAAVLSSGYRSSERAMLTLLDASLDSAADRSAERTIAFLDPAVRSNELAVELFERGELGASDLATLEAFFLGQVAVNPEFGGVYWGGADGSFLFVRRDTSRPGAAYLTRSIELNVLGQRVTTLVWRDRDHRMLASEQDRGDLYDPRTRLWYLAARSSSEPIWTDPYLFFSTNQPGITLANALRFEGEMVGAIGVDINLAGLSTFLGSLDISDRGSAFIVSESGTIFATPDSDFGSGLPGQGGVALGDGAARAGYSAFADGPPEDGLLRWDAEFDFDGSAHRASFVPFSVDASNTWIIGAYAPEGDFVGELQDRARSDLMIAIGIALLLTSAGLWVVERASAPVSALQDQADTDQLTGLANRRHLFEVATQAATQAAVLGKPFALAMIDVDDFKGINDRYGHAIGDEVLSALAGRFRQSLREGALLARYGGEEFAVVLPGTDLVGAFGIVDRLRATVADAPLRTSAGLVELTLSAGVAELSRSVPDLDSLLLEADRALYRAKDLGRNCVIASGF